MIADILCPGPSLPRYKPRGSPLVIGVNRAALYTSCHWQACGDPGSFTATPVMGYLTKAYAVDAIRSGWHRDRLNNRLLWTFEGLGHVAPASIEWDVFSATAATVLAISLGADCVDVWGSDLCGVSDWDGHTAADADDGRSDARWVREAGIWQRLTLWAESRGVRIRKGE